MVKLVTGATGTQGSAVAHALLARGLQVRALVRDAEAPAARSLARAGAELAAGRFEDGGSLHAAMAGVDAVFSVQLAPGGQPDSERDQARALMQAARDAGVRQIVHSSVSNTGAFRTMAGWNEGRWSRNYWESKADAEDIVRRAGFPLHTILRPAFMMDNFAAPKAAWMFPDLSRGEILTAVAADTPMVLIAAADIGEAAAAAMAEPDRFAGQAIELAGDLRTLPQVAAILAEVKGAPVAARTLDAETLVARGQNPGWVETQEWMNVVNYPARPEAMRQWGLTSTSFTDWARRHAAAIDVGGGD